MQVTVFPMGDTALLVEVADLPAVLAVDGAVRIAVATGRLPRMVDQVPAARTVLLRPTPGTDLRRLRRQVENLCAAIYSGAAVHSGAAVDSGAAAIPGAATDSGAAVIPGAATDSGAAVNASAAAESSAGADAHAVAGSSSAGNTGAAEPADRHDHPVVIPVVYDGPDLAEVAKLTGMSVEGVIAVHTGSHWRCAFGGFAPGFGYLVGGDRRLQVPRRAHPRTSIPAGSVGLAGEFSGVYPRSSPGGWQLIGRTEIVMWDVDRDPPALLRPGVGVRFLDVGAGRG